MKDGLLIAFFISFSVQVFAQVQTSPTKVIAFEDLPRLVRERNQNVKAAETSISAAKERTGFFTRSFLPHLALKAGSESAKFGSESLIERGFWRAEGRINIYQGGKDRLEEKIREAQTESSYINAAKEYQMELREARKAYWKLVAISKMTADLKEYWKNNDENIKSARRRAGAGVTTNADVLQFELENTLLHQQFKKLTLEEDLLKNSLSVAISEDTHENLKTSGEFPHPPDQLAVRTSGTSNLTLDLLKSENSVQELRSRQAGRWWLPKIDLYSSYGIPSLIENDTRALVRETDLYAGVLVTFNLGQGLEDRAESKALDFDRQASSLRLSHSEREVVATNHELIHDLKLLHELIHDAEEDVEKAAAFLRLTKAEYSRGVKNGPDLLGALSKYYEFKTRFTELHLAYYEALADKDFHDTKKDLAL